MKSGSMLCWSFHLKSHRVPQSIPTNFLSPNHINSMYKKAMMFYLFRCIQIPYLLRKRPLTPTF